MLDVAPMNERRLLILAAGLAFAVDLKTVKALGIAVPKAFLLRADRVIE